MVTFSLKNMLSSIHPADRVMMHGHAGGGNGYAAGSGWSSSSSRGTASLVNVLTRAMGRVRNVAGPRSTGKARPDAWTSALAGGARLPPVGRGDEPEPRRAVAAWRSRTSSVVDGFVGDAPRGAAARHADPARAW